MTLTIPDVEKWVPEELTTAATAVGKLSGDLDRTVMSGIAKTQALAWDGAAAAAAADRLTTEKARSSAVSGALLQLQSALTQQVDNLLHTKQTVLDLRNQAEHPPGAGIPGYTVSPTGAVSADARIDWIRRSRRGPHGEDLFTEARMQAMIGTEYGEALAWQVKIMRALQQAENVAEQAITTVNQAQQAIAAAHQGLGDPITGAGGAPVVPTATPVAAVAPAPPPPPAAPVAHEPLGSSPGRTTFHGVTDGHNGGVNIPAADTNYQTVAYAHSHGNTQADWIQQAKDVLIGMGYPPHVIDENAIATIIKYESGGNPEAINNYDSNAAAGHPSIGLMQTINSTFNAYMAPGHGDIRNPVDNIIAASRYAIARYGSLQNVPGVVAVAQGLPYRGY
ncbi:transglycosylase SLT domain-containing protein [Nocardia sp. alder85J]|uniref:transglycosylase SLT domain-containing protein n=1 Tax=Nocardia sp. alder85J TaxID=2862949 RepID=UPI001CD51AB9|nr:transglycosylase SLT domain-containing protein [Nocardia sp. alder85J]MCX4097845.1 transglycosylase SLT domain-containing protein [Nocardia sp. alder85J]